MSDCAWTIERVGEQYVHRCAHCEQVPTIMDAPYPGLRRNCKRAAQEKKPPKAADRSPPIECAHRGERTRLEKCQTCKGNVSVKIHACAIHGECTSDKRFAGIQDCESCENYCINFPPTP